MAEILHRKRLHSRKKRLIRPNDNQRYIIRRRNFTTRRRDQQYRPQIFKSFHRLQHTIPQRSKRRKNLQLYHIRTRANFPRIKRQSIHLKINLNDSAIVQYFG